MDNFFSGFHLGSLVSKWKWHLLIIAIIAGITGYVVSRPFVIKPKFKSTAIVYPSNIAPYSEENETEQMIQWLTSEDVRDSVINRLHLDKHYGIDPSYVYYASSMDYLYNKNVSISKTPYLSINITATDTDPKIACAIVNTIIKFTNLKIQNTHKEKFEEALTAFDITLDLKKKEIDSTRNLLNLLAAGKNISPNLAHYMDVRGIPGSENISSNTTALKQEKAGDLYFLTFRLQTLIDEYSVIMKSYNIAIFDCNRDQTYLNLITKPLVADKKYWPKGSFFVPVFTLSALLLALLVLAIVERYSQRKSN